MSTPVVDLEGYPLDLGRMWVCSTDRDIGGMEEVSVQTPRQRLELARLHHIRVLPNDTLVDNQWHLFNTFSSRTPDLRLKRVFKRGSGGQGQPQLWIPPEARCSFPSIGKRIFATSGLRKGPGSNNFFVT